MSLGIRTSRFWRFELRRYGGGKVLLSVRLRGWRSA